MSDMPFRVRTGIIFTECIGDVVLVNKYHTLLRSRNYSIDMDINMCIRKMLHLP